MSSITNIFNIVSDKSPGSIPLLIIIRGSHAYGTNIETSDIDYAGVYIQSIEDILGFGYKEQISDDSNDIVFYEIKRFLELLKINNPNILELLNSPENCILYKHPIFDEILNQKDKFITKSCAKSFAGYAIAQIRKAKGQDKKQNWEKNRITRKNPIDFCYLHIKEKSVPLSEFFSENNIDQKYCGLSKVVHSRETYTLFYDKSKVIGFKGISFEKSNDIRLSSIPVDCPDDYFLGYVSYNKDGYRTHCDDYKSYQTWLLNKNESRWIDVKNHDQKIDGKNMMHCRRLLDVAKEIGEGKGVNVFRPNNKYLISIRKGEVDLQKLIEESNNIINEINIIFENSDLPENVSDELINNLLINIRKYIYKI